MNTDPAQDANSKPQGLNRRQAVKTIAAGALAAGGASRKTSANQSFEQFNDPAKGGRSKTSFLKQRAANDYRNSMSPFGGRLSSPIADLLGECHGNSTPHFSVAVIGSGYGASICAARLSEQLADDQRLCILERGCEWVPGSFPDSFRDLRKNSRITPWGKNRGQVENPLGLFNLTLSSEVNLLAASALGGTSLINANVALRPDADVFRQSIWPQALSEREVLDPYYEVAARELNLTRTPYDQTPKVRTRRQAAYNISKRAGFFDRSPLSVMYDHRYLDDEMRNPHGIVQRPCTLCGDCVTGCNVGAKNTLVTNYLPKARMNGAEIYTQVEVKRIRKANVGYVIDLDYHDNSSGSICSHPFSISAEVVVLGCGSPGSSQILMQSQQDGFCFSRALGQNWSYNGDTIGFVMDGKFQSNMSGVGAYDCHSNGPGPTLQTSMIYERRQHLKHRILIQEAAVPRAVVGLFKFLLKDRQLDNSMVMLGMGMDEGTGKVVWKDGRWQISWPGLKQSRFRKMMFAEFERVAHAHGGWYKRLKEFGDNLVSVHPLGACGMSDDPTKGVVNHLGQVYDGRHGGCCDGHGQPEIHKGLYVSDASVIPTALGVNPFMTISALSERTARHIVANPNHAHLFKARERTARQAG